MKVYKKGDLLRLLNATRLYSQKFIKGLHGCAPHTIIMRGLSTIYSLPLFYSLGATYLWGYLRLVHYAPSESLGGNDFLLFAITLRNELDVLNKTMKRYVMEAWRVLITLGYSIPNPSRSGCFTTLRHMRKDAPVKPKRVYCSIPWSAVLQ